VEVTRVHSFSNVSDMQHCSIRTAKGPLCPVYVHVLVQEIAINFIRCNNQGIVVGAAQYSICIVSLAGRLISIDMPIPNASQSMGLYGDGATD
jgi:hypothetical protein